MNEEKKTKRTIIICICVVAVVIVLCVLAINYSKTDSVSTDDATTEEQTEETTVEGIEEIDLGETEEEPSQAEAAEEPQAPEIKYYGGTYAITSSATPAEGEMPEGEYVLEPNYPEGSFELVSDLSGDEGSIITNGTYNLRTYVTVSEGQYLKFDGVAIPVEDADAYISKNGYYDPQAMYKVGFDIQPGTYAVRLGLDDQNERYTEGSVIVLSDSTGSEDSVISETVITENTEIDLKDDTYIKIYGVNLSEPIN